MDFVATLTEGVVLGAPWVVAGLVTALLARNRLKHYVMASILDEFYRFFDEVRHYPEAYEDLTAPLMAGAQEIVSGSLSDVAREMSKSPALKEWASEVVGIAMGKLASDVQKNPDKYANLLKPVFAKAVKDFTSGGPSGVMPKFKIQDALGLLLQQFVGRMASGAQAEGAKKLAEVATEANPFA